MSSSSKYQVAQEVLAERVRQDARWGEQNHPDGTGPHMLIGGRDVASYVEQVKLEVSTSADPSYAQILLEEVLEAFCEVEPALLRAELVQVSAVAIKWIEVIDRRRAGGPRLAIDRAFTASHGRLVFLLARFGDLTHGQLHSRHQQMSARPGAAAWPFISESGLRTRVSELVRWGLVEPSDAEGRTIANRPTRAWRLCANDPAARGLAGPPPADRDAREALEGLLLEAGSDVVVRAAVQHLLDLTAARS